MPITDDDRTTLVDNEQHSEYTNGGGGGGAVIHNQHSGGYNEDADAEDGGGIYAGGFVADDVQNTSIAAAAKFDDISNENDTIPGTLFQSVPLQRQQTVIYSEPPPDRYNFTFYVFYLLGAATMTPWNFFVTAEDYWMYKFRNTTINSTTPEILDTDLTPMQKSFTCDLTLTASMSGTTFLILNAIYGHHVSMKLKMLSTLSMILAIFIVTTAFVEVNTDHWQEQFFLITLFTIVIINISSATMSGGIFGIAGLFPSKYMSAMVSGQALGGIFTALAFIAVLAFGATPKTTAFVYFTIGTVTIVLSIVTFTIMSNQSFYKYYMEGGDKYTIVCPSTSSSASSMLPANTAADNCNQIDGGVALEPNIRETFSKIYMEAVCICILFATTLSVYPAVSVLVQSENFGNGKAWNDIYYLPVVNYLFFNCGDYFGRILAGIFERPRKNAQTVLLMTVLRILYVPFFLCSNSNQHIFLPVIVHSDIAFIFMILTFALSNGYLANILLILAPRCVMQHEREIASSIMAAALSCGLAVGSMLSMVFVQML